VERRYGGDSMKKIKVALLISLVCLVWANLLAQIDTEEIHFMVNLGGTVSSLVGEPNYRYYYDGHQYYYYYDYYYDRHYYYDHRYYHQYKNEIDSMSGLQLGVSAMVLNDRMPALPEIGVRFNQRGYSYFIQEHTLSYLDAYVLFKYNPHKSIFAVTEDIKGYPYIGVAESFLLSTSSQFYLEEKDTSGWFRSTDFSLLLGIECITWEKLSLRIEYMRGLNEVFTPKAQIDRTNRHRREAFSESVSFSVGWIF